MKIVNSLTTKITKSFTALLLILLAINAHAVRTTTYYHTDGLGSVVAASDESGNLLWRKSYAPYGEQIDGNTDNEPLSYTGKQHDDATGLTYFGARYYDPRIGRFMATDPVHFMESNPVSFNRYAYVNNNPYKYVDPDGKLLFLAPIAIFIIKEIAAEGLSQATGGATDFLSVRRMGMKGIKFAKNKLTEAVQTVNRDAAIKDALKKAGSGKSGGRNLPFKDADRLNEVNKTLDRIESAGPFPYKKDGTVFKNKEGKLPDGNYREYTVDTSGASDRGARRVVQDGDSGRTYYTDDHYKNFIQIDPVKR